MTDGKNSMTSGSAFIAACGARSASVHGRRSSRAVRSSVPCADHDARCSSAPERVGDQRRERQLGRPQERGVRPELGDGQPHHLAGRLQRHRRHTLLHSFLRDGVEVVEQPSEHDDLGVEDVDQVADPEPQPPADPVDDLARPSVPSGGGVDHGHSRRAPSHLARGRGRRAARPPPPRSPSSRERRTGTAGPWR